MSTGVNDNRRTDMFMTSFLISSLCTWLLQKHTVRVSQDLEFCQSTGLGSKSIRQGAVHVWGGQKLLYAGKAVLC